MFCLPKTAWPPTSGLLLQVPHEFLLRECAQLGILLPAPKGYGVGMVCLPTDATQRTRCQEIFEGIVRDEGQVLLGWRDLPTNNTPIGPSARSVEPVFRQIFIGRGAGITDAAQFERTLFLIRKRAENAILASGLPQSKYFYHGSLSCNTIVYKGMLSADQIETYFPDVTDPEVMSALALVHQRFSTNTFPTWSLAQVGS